MIDDVAAFGARLGEFRRSAGLSQQELAERSGLSIRAISNLERGRARWPHLDSVHRLADVLGLHDQARAQFLAAAARRPTRTAAGPVTTAPGDRLPSAGGGQVAPRQLPAPVQHFVGRENELKELTGLLDRAGGQTPKTRYRRQRACRVLLVGAWPVGSGCPHVRAARPASRTGYHDPGRSQSSWDTTGARPPDPE
jgi:DNA-binding XRE family transcriptional regulator